MIEIKKLENIEDYKKLPAIQKSAWGFSDDQIAPHHLMRRVQKYGGLVQGLFVDGMVIGFSYAIIGKWQGEYFIYSHMVAVLREYQNQGYGFLLKKAQREEVLKMDYDVIRWNFDPLESLNSYFNIHKLGVISVEYDRNIYGIGDSGLHKGLPTDRLIATWNLKSARVIEKMKKKEPPIIEHIPQKSLENLTEEATYFEIPRDIRSIKKNNLKEAYEWRMKSRDFFESAFDKGYVAEHIVFSEDNERIFFKLKREKVNR